MGKQDKMDRRQFLFGAAAAAPLLGARSAFGAEPGPRDAELRALLDTFWNADLDAAPQMATERGLDVGPRAAQRGKLNDASRAGRNAWIAARKERLAALARISPEDLSPAARVDHEVTTYTYRRTLDGGMKYDFGEGQAGFGYAPYSPYVLSQLTGAYQAIPDFLDSRHPVRTTEDAEAYLSRLEAYAMALDANTQALALDAAKGVLAPDFALDAGLAQLRRQRAVGATDASVTRSLATRAAKTGLTGDWAGRAAAIVSAAVYPALDRQIAALEAARAKATSDAGAWKLPDGDAFYADALAFQTTTRRTPDEVHRLGLQQVAELEAQIDTRLRRLGLTTGTVAQRLTALSARPDQQYANTDAGRAQLLADLNAQTAAIRARMGTVFRTLPAAPVEIVRVPPEIEDGAPNGYAQAPALDGSRPGRFYINLKDTAEWPKFNLPTLTYHEALPGHVWQGSISLGSQQIPMLRRAGMGFAAYGEGWALYAEQLAAEMGVYEGDPLGEIGYLQSLQFRAVRLVVDTGLHFKRWTRAQATDYMVSQTGMPRARVQREIDRYCVWPGQACSYKIGHVEWVRLREEAKKRVGARFDLKTFHDVLLQGPMPLVVLEQTLATMFPA
ncbi:MULTISPECIES: DUF885 family protein [unclassified Caulobacter]|uniref:DUF885 domain-containing protein n=1 Tax=unclassified Caulobacter TaxID=2648921 RepID=UPI00143D1EBE|nr:MULTISPECIES: DUF885 family protein [unclassified Caulobacter]